MKTTNSIRISTEYDRVFRLASRVEEWGRILPHYRYVKLLKRRGNRKLVRMSAWRDVIPVTWTAVETVVPGTECEPGRIEFRHVRGLVRGMHVVWSFEHTAGGDLLVTIAHDLEQPPFPVRLLGRVLTERIVGEGFIGNIAGKTLARIKELAESQEDEAASVR